MNRLSLTLILPSLLLLTACPVQPQAENDDPGLPLNGPPSPPAGLLTEDDAWAFIKGELGQMSGGAVAVADLTGDGIADLAMGAPGNSHGQLSGEVGRTTGRVYIFPGPIGDEVTSLSQAPIILYAEDDRFPFGANLSAGDLDGDGVADLVVQNPSDTYVFYGPIGEGFQSSAEADARVRVDDWWFSLPHSDHPLADFDGDGDLDIILQHQQNGFLIFDAPTGEASSSSAIGRISSDATRLIQSQIETGDLNGDGIDDLVARSWDGSTGLYSLHVFTGPLSGERSFEESDAEILHARGGQVVQLDPISPASDLLVIFRENDPPQGWSLRRFMAPEGFLTEADGELLLQDGSVDEAARINTLSSGDLNDDGQLDLLVGQRIFYGPFTEALPDEAADVVLEGQCSSSFISADLNFDGVDDTVCRVPGYFEFEDQDEGRSFRPNGAVMLYAGGRD